MSRVLVALICFAALPASAQQPAQRHIVDTAINLGWISGILQTDGLRPDNLAEITTALGNAAAHVAALQPLVSSPPYDRQTFARVQRRITNLGSRIGSMETRAALREIRGVRSAMQTALRVFLDARTNRLSVASSCDSAIFRVGYHFGVGHTAIQRGNVQLERRARDDVRRSIGVGTQAQRRLMCPFAADAYTGIAMMGAQSPTTYAQSLPQIQGATLAGGGATPPPGVAPPAPPTPPTPPAVAPATTTPSTSAAARPDLSGRCQWSSSWGVVHFDEGYYGIRNKTIRGQLVLENGAWVYRGRWGRGDSDRWGNVEFRFTSATRFEGHYTNSAGERAGHWNGRAECSRR